jgi:hypothetical protein
VTFAQERVLSLSELSGLGLQEFSWSTKGAGAYRGSLGFAERNVHRLRANGASAADWFSHGLARAYSVEDFTLIHASATGPGTTDWCSPEVRDWEDIAHDRRDRYALMLVLSV